MNKILMNLSCSFRNIGKNKILYLILVIQCILAFILCLLLSQTYLTINQKYERENMLYGDKQYYYLGNFSKLSNVDSNGNHKEYHQAKDVISEINKNSNYSLIRIVNTNIDIKDKTLPNEFSFGYSCGNDEETYTADGHTYQRLDYVALSPEAFKGFDISVESGRPFNQNDYEYSNSKIWPVLLGYNYKDYFKIGDQFSAVCYDDIDCQVVGFLNKNSSYLMNDKITYLDHSMVLPAVYISSSEPNENQRIMLGDQLSQSLISVKGKSEDETVKYITSACIKANSSTLWSIVPSNPLESIAMIKSTRENLSLTLILTISLIIFTVISLSVALLAIIKKNYYEYGIHLTCGATLKSIFLQICLYPASILVIALLISVNYFKTVLSILSSNAIYITLGVALIIFIISVIPSYFTIRKLDISNLIRGKE